MDLGSKEADPPEVKSRVVLPGLWWGLWGYGEMLTKGTEFQQEGSIFQMYYWYGEYNMFKTLTLLKGQILNVTKRDI